MYFEKGITLVNPRKVHCIKCGDVIADITADEKLFKKISAVYIKGNYIEVKCRACKAITKINP